MILEEYGETHFKAFEEPVLYFQVTFVFYSPCLCSLSYSILSYDFYIRC